MSPLLGVGGFLFAGSAMSNPQYGWITSVIVGALFALLVFCGCAFALIGLAAAIFDRRNRRSLLTNSLAGIAGPLFFAGFLAVSVPAHEAAQGVAANERARDVVAEFSRNPGPREGQRERFISALRAAAVESEGESIVVLEDVARTMERIVDAEREMLQAWDAFTAIPSTTDCFGQGDRFAERRHLLGEVRTATLRWVAELRTGEARLSPFLLENASRAWFELSVRGPLEKSSLMFDLIDERDRELTLPN